MIDTDKFLLMISKDGHDRPKKSYQPTKTEQKVFGRTIDVRFRKAM